MRKNWYRFLVPTRVCGLSMQNGDLRLIFQPHSESSTVSRDIAAHHWSYLIGMLFYRICSTHWSLGTIGRIFRVTPHERLKEVVSKHKKPPTISCQPHPA